MKKKEDEESIFMWEIPKNIQDVIGNINIISTRKIKDFYKIYMRPQLFDKKLLDSIIKPKSFVEFNYGKKESYIKYKIKK